MGAGGAFEKTTHYRWQRTTDTHSSSMSYRRATQHRFRAIVATVLIVLTIFYVSSAHRSASASNDAASILQWMKAGGYEILLPPVPDTSSSRVKSLQAQVTPPSKTKGGSKKGDEALELDDFANNDQQPIMDPLEKEFFSWRGEQYEMNAKPPPKPPRETVPPISDPFPLLSQKSAPELRRILKIPEMNTPPSPHVPEDTPLLIGFTRNWPQLIQCVSSYIAAGWPASDIYVVENTGVMFSNRDGLLTLQNPFYMNHTQLQLLGVNVLVTPTLLSFAQLQNFYAWTALERNWTDFFWSHQDVVAFSFEKEFRPASLGSDEMANYSLYTRALAVLRYLRQPGIPKWANHFFAYDHLTLVHTKAIIDIGGWDTHIPFYATDCDMYDRLKWAGYFQGSTQVGIVIDTSTVLDDVAAFFRVPGVHATFQGDPGPDNAGDSADEDIEQQLLAADFEEAEVERKKLVEKKGETVDYLVEISYRMQAIKYVDGGWWRNLWQKRQGGGQGEPFYRDPEGFQTGVDMLIETGRRVFAEKYGHRGCDIEFMGIKAEDAWRIEKDWDPETEGTGSEGPYW